MTTETRKRRSYTEDFKRDAVALVTGQGYKPSEAARSLDIGDNLLRRWLREFEEEASGTRLSGDEREELKRLRKENRMLRMENTDSVSARNHTRNGQVITRNGGDLYIMQRAEPTGKTRQAPRRCRFTNTSVLPVATPLKPCKRSVIRP